MESILPDYIHLGDITEEILQTNSHVGHTCYEKNTSGNTLQVLFTCLQTNRPLTSRALLLTSRAHPPTSRALLPTSKARPLTSKAPPLTTLTSVCYPLRVVGAGTASSATTTTGTQGRVETLSTLDVRAMATTLRTSRPVTPGVVGQVGVFLQSHSGLCYTYGCNCY